MRFNIIAAKDNREKQPIITDGRRPPGFEADGPLRERLMAETPSRLGWVYVLTNPAFPGMVKIGFTSETPRKRAADLSRATGVPLPFTVVWARAVSDCAYVEAAVHRLLDDKRVQGKKAAGARKEAEFFRVDVRTARQVIEAAAGACLGPVYRPGPTRQPHKRWRGRARRHSRRGDGLALCLLAGVTVFLALFFLKPPTGWLPRQAAEVAVAIERLNS